MITDTTKLQLDSKATRLLKIYIRLQSFVVEYSVVSRSNIIEINLFKTITNNKR